MLLASVAFQPCTVSDLPIVALYQSNRLFNERRHLPIFLFQSSAILMTFVWVKKGVLRIKFWPEVSESTMTMSSFRGWESGGQL